MNRPTAYKVTLERWQSRGGSRGGRVEVEHRRERYGQGMGAVAAEKKMQR